MEPIAIVGMAARFPQAWDLDEFWANLVAGRESVTFFDRDTLLAAGVPDAVAAHPRFVPAEPRLPGFDEIDAELFGLTPREARLAAPAFRVFIESVHAAIEHAGRDPYHLAGPVAVYGAVGSPRYLYSHAEQERSPSTQGVIAMLNNADYLATQVCYRFNFTGPAMTVLTACSSGLTTVHLAIQALQAGECAYALAGGVSIEDSPYGYFHVPGGVRSPDGHCRPFDRSGGGTVFGSGAGVVLLRRLADAAADRDHVYAVIRGTGLNNDGGDKTGFGAPRPGGQQECITAALRASGLRPADLSYVEAHGTGTAVGDQVELDALVAAWRDFGDPPPAGGCGIGAVKSNIGHTVQAAGVASLIKLALAFDRERLPPSINIEAPSAQFAEPGHPLYPVTRVQDWRRDPRRPRRAGLSSFGVGGTNAHMILEEAPAVPPAAPLGRPRAIIWSARDEAAADAYRATLAASGTFDDFDGTVTTLQRGRTPYPVRRAVVAADAGEAAQALSGSGSTAVIGGTADSVPALAWLFPGQGSLFAGAGVQLAGEYPLFARCLDEAFGALGDAADATREAWRTGTDESLVPTGIAQPVLFAVELALARAWLEAGVRPDIVAGHSLGELVAATVAGVCSPEDAGRLVVARARAMQAMPPGSMAAVFTGLDAVRERLPAGLTVAAANAPHECVVGGPAELVDRFVAELRAGDLRAIPLRTSHAFHTPSMGPAAEQFLGAVADVSLRRPEIPFVSAYAGRLVDEEVLDPSFWAGQLTAPVRFDQATQAMLAWCAGQDRRLLAVEQGPAAALTSFLRAGDTARVTTAVTLPRPKASQAGQAVRHGTSAIAAAFATAWVNGVAVDWERVDGDAPDRRVSVPGYRYQRTRYYIDAPIWASGVPKSTPTPAAQPSAAAIDRADEDKAAPAPVASPLAKIVWVEQERDLDGAAVRRRRGLVVLPPDSAQAQRAAVALQQAGISLVTLRPGGEFAVRGTEVVADLTRADHLDRLGDWVRGQPPIEIVVHAETLGPWPDTDPDNVEDQLDATVRRFVALVAAAGRVAPEARLAVLTTQSADVSGGEPLTPIKSALHGLVRTLRAEVPASQARLIDLATNPVEEELVQELMVDGAPALVALRGRRRWTPHEVTMPVPAGRDLPLRRKGVYLITGGLGALGREVVRGLARTGLQPTCVLMSRGQPGATGATGVAELADEVALLGATVTVQPGDVADERDVRRVLDITTAKHGPLHGVFHLAGIAGDGVLLLRGQADLDRVLRPKIAGTLVLAAALTSRPPLDFWVQFASRAGVDGLAGSGDYAAANAFLDAWALARDGGPTRTVSIDWPSWAEAGMAAVATGSPAGSSSRPSTGPADRPLVWRHAMSAAASWELDEHRINGTSVLPGAAQVDLLLRAYHQVVDPAVEVAVRDLVFVRPIVVGDQVEIEVEFAPDGAGHRAELRARTLPDGDWQVHSAGHFAPVEDPILRRVDLGTIEPDARPAPASTAPPDERFFTLGHHWDCVRQVIDGADERVVRLALPPDLAHEAADRPLHPALLDCATASARRPGEGPYIPFLYTSLTVSAPLPPELVSRVTRTSVTESTITADIDVIAPDGLVVAEIEGFTMRRFQPGDLASAGGPARLTTPPTTPPAAPSSVGIPPEQGADLLIDVLAGRTPAQVVVRPFRDGAPVPLRSALRPAPPVADGAVDGPAVAPAGPVPVASTAPSTAPASGPATPASTLDRMRLIWRDVLGMADIGDDDDFFEIGGDSLTAIELVGRVREELGGDLTVAAMLDASTLGAMAKATHG